MKNLNKKELKVVLEAVRVHYMIKKNIIEDTFNHNYEQKEILRKEMEKLDKIYDKIYKEVM